MLILRQNARFDGKLFTFGRLRETKMKWRAFVAFRKIVVMPILPIVHYPEEVLLTVGKPIGDDEFGEELARTVEDMFATMADARGVGLAAPQVGISRRLFVMDTPESDDHARERHVLINPEIIHVEGEQTGDEGCLSFPGLYQTVRREMRVIARAQNIKGEQIEIDVQDLAARCILHETDHCDGIVFLDRMTPLKRQFAKRKIKTLQKTGKWN
jgi:peptide deformylase